MELGVIACDHDGPPQLRQLIVLHLGGICFGNLGGGGGGGAGGVPFNANPKEGLPL